MEYDSFEPFQPERAIVLPRAVCCRLRLFSRQEWSQNSVRSYARPGPVKNGLYQREKSLRLQTVAFLPAPFGLSLSQIIAPEAPLDEDREKSPRREYQHLNPVVDRRTPCYA